LAGRSSARRLTPFVRAHVCASNGLALQPSSRFAACPFQRHSKRRAQLGRSRPSQPLRGSGTAFVPLGVAPALLPRRFASGWRVDDLSLARHALAGWCCRLAAGAGAFSRSRGGWGSVGGVTQVRSSRRGCSMPAQALTSRSTGRAGSVLQLGEPVVGAPVNSVR
jgi:hypothetical protein